jgi:hypothetical protein
MKRTIGLFMFGSSLALLILGTVFGLTGLVQGAQATDAQSAAGAPVTAGQPSPTEEQLLAFEASIQQRDAAYRDQIAAAERTLVERDQVFQTQLKQAQDQLAVQRQALIQAQTEARAAQAQTVRLQNAIATADAQFKSEMEAKTAQLTADEAQLQEQIKQTYAALQSAYNEIAARQAAGDGGGDRGGGGGGGGGGRQDDDHSDHEDRGHDHEDKGHDDDD